MIKDKQIFSTMNIICASNDISFAYVHPKKDVSRVSFGVPIIAYTVNINF